MIDNRLHDRLVTILVRRSLRIGDFTLSSGRRSSYYIDARQTTLSAEGLEVIGALGLALIRDSGWAAELVGGLTLGADPVAYAVALASRRAPPVIDAFTVRKEPKTHGTGQLIEGCFVPGARAVITEDVLTTGASALHAVKAVREAGGVVVGVLAVVDREEGGRAALERAGHAVRALVSVSDLGVEPSAG